ncbi:MAG: aspartyl/asparaginyl-tRNA synthetase [Alphaproteobacteria bacterium]
MREFFTARGFIEVHPQSRQSFLAIADDISTIATYNYGNESYLLPQSAHMWLEFELLKNPELPGVFCCSTSYRQHKNPVAGRHENIFPIFDFETAGGIESMAQLQKDILTHFGFSLEDLKSAAYDKITLDFGVKKIDATTESRIGNELSSIMVIKDKPNSLNPSWSHKRVGEHVKTSDVILYGMETIGASERGTNAEYMRERFYAIDGGNVAKTLFDTFGQGRVERELGEFLSLDLFPRSTGSIGLTRMIRALRLLDNELRSAEVDVPFYEVEDTALRSTNHPSL